MGMRAVVFDLDGTLVDSAPDLVVAMNKLLGEEGRRAIDLDQMKTLIGEGSRRAVEKALALTGGVPAGDLRVGISDDRLLDGLTGRYLAHYAGHTAERSRLYPGTIETLAALKAGGWSLGVCTNKPQAASLEMLAAFGLDGFMRAVVGGDAIAGIRKPDPRHLLAVLDRLGVAPADAVMVGDSQHDVKAARGLGVPVLAVTFGYSAIPAEALGADAVIAGFQELPGALERLAPAVS
jgi:phosphoglycolate phosphatase